MYQYGQGVPQDYKTAVKWYTRAAEQREASAQTNLGHMYATGRGVLQNDVYAHMWFNIAAFNGEEKSSKKRNEVAKRMTTEQIAEAQKLARECVAKN
ncbi:MAG: tetratricopeptide repeat protein, partial [Opitutae bacterium]